MGYIIGGSKRAGIVAGTDAEFKKAIQSSGDISLQAVPEIKPVASYGRKTTTGGMLKSGGYADITRTAPLFNDPRYTSSTLAINRTVAFQGDLN